ncbi:MAG: DUF6600 domain-containing protein [Bryobacteraceae bacterium]
MWRDLFTMFLAAVFAVFAIEPPLAAQDGAAPPPSGQQYPAAQYPQAQYPQAQYPQAQYPQGQYPQGQPPNGQQDPNAQDQAADQQHGVARISIVQGDVNVKRGDSGELVAAAINAPLMAQDHLQTSPGSRAEVELDSANLIRLAPNTDIGFADVEYRRYQFQLGAGTMIYRVLRDSNAQAEIDTPSIALKPEAEGEYRISVLDDGTTQITVRSGQAEIYSPRGSQRVDPGHSILVRGNPSDPEFQNTYEVARDQFDDWSATRDHELLSSRSYQYVSRDIYGADDLDAYGNWVPSQYGQVWAPQPPVADWSPYSYGQWTYEPYYGWTWVDSAPWGWAPYHYGRWFWNTGVGWCWWPGARLSSYFWSPALVGFFGWGGIGIGLGWVALAPFELFHAWWGHGWGGGYGRGEYGGFRNGNLAGMYRNAGIRGGAITTAYNSFGRGGQRFSPATRGQLAGATPFRGGLPVSPTRASYQFSNRAAVANPRLASAANRQFFQHQQPRTQAFSGASRFASAQPGSHGVAPNMQGAQAGRNSYAAAPRTSGGGGWQRFGDPGTSNGLRQSFAGGQEASGWHRFGQPQPSAPAYGRAGNQPRSTYAQPSFAQPNSGRSFGTGNSNGNYQSRPLGMNGYNAGRSTYSAPRYNSPAAPRYSAPAAPHYSAPSASKGGGSSHGGGSPRSSGGSSHGGGGGHSSSGGGHHGR